ncbi:uncharacterized protein GGS22DRAFT_185777 [Annulohypoxylon maeteangense]|uniref:uncharacterized protein n=1 Tax=Annulohypoxylon maeteangense TaxID=1927788 RepID=UPI00200794D3|nr:uncharacterized protein GGS22DRAFT_185777 [Annulohypoxylon maeteangense]KAI0888400.1 hypothetical protein GGS22DRAFT_185777 [Annulohypoxylon maeteangense]
MTRYNRGIAGEKAAVREEQREAARQLDEDASRRRPSLGEVETPTSATEEKKTWLPGKFIVKKPTKAACGRLVVEREDAMPLRMERCLDMAPVKKGAFFYMSARYCEDVVDWCRFSEEQQGATF